MRSHYVLSSVPEDHKSQVREGNTYLGKKKIRGFQIVPQYISLWNVLCDNADLKKKKSFFCFC